MLQEKGIENAAENEHAVENEQHSLSAGRAGWVMIQLILVWG